MRDIVSRAVVLLIILKSDPDTDFIFRLYLVSVFINDRNIKQTEISDLIRDRFFQSVAVSEIVFVFARDLADIQQRIRRNVRILVIRDGDLIGIAFAVDEEGLDDDDGICREFL